MPKVTKYLPPKKKKRSSKSSGGSIVSRIAPVALNQDGIMLSLYGRSKTGKTRLACTFPKPLLLIGTEKGTRSVANVKGVDFVRLQKSEEMGELVALLEMGKYASVALDTAGGLQDVVLKEILGLEDMPVQKSWGFAERSDWQTCGSQVKERLRAMLALSESHGINVVVIAHERNFSDESSSDLIFPTVGSALTPSVAGWLNGACDYICQTFIREQTEQKSLKVGKKSTPILRKTGVQEYCLRTGPHPVYMTGFRLPLGRDKLPDVIVNPSCSKIKKLIDQGG